MPAAATVEVVRVLVVTTWLPTPAAPDTGIFVERDIELIAESHEVHVVHLSASGDGGRPHEASADRAWTLETVAMSPANPRSVAGAASMLRGRIDEFDLVHTMAASALLPFRRLVPRSPWVHTEHWSALLAPKTVSLPARLALPLTKRLLTRPDVVVAVGRRLADEIDRRRTRATVVIPNAVERPAALVDPPARDRVRLVAVGGLIARKGPDLAVRALAELVSRGRDAELAWVGEGPMREPVSALADELGVADRVVLLGRVEPVAVPALLDRSDLFLLPTESETFGVAIAEALMHGRPVVVGAEGGQSEFVAEPDGALVAERSAEAYADAVERVLRANAGRTPAQIARRVSERFTDEARAGAYAAAYAEAERGARARR